MRNILDSAANKKEHFEGGRLVVTSVSIAPRDDHAGSTMVVDSTVNQAALRVVNRRAQTVASTTATIGARFRTWLTWRNAAWLIVDWKQAKT
jgi:hypothetical protein